MSGRAVWERWSPAAWAAGSGGARSPPRYPATCRRRYRGRPAYATSPSTARGRGTCRMRRRPHRARRRRVVPRHRARHDDKHLADGDLQSRIGSAVGTDDAAARAVVRTAAVLPAADNRASRTYRGALPHDTRVGFGADKARCGHVLIRTFGRCHRPDGLDLSVPGLADHAARSTLTVDGPMPVRPWQPRAIQGEFR